jgi:hypothetical protein
VQSTLALYHLIQGSFQKLMESPYYTKSELCGGAVMVSFRSTFLGKWCTAYNVPPTSRKCAADWSLQNFLPQSSLFMVGKARKSHEARSGLYGGCSNGVPLIHSFQAEHRIQFRSYPMWFLGFSNHGTGALRQISKLSMACCIISRNGWSFVRSPSLAMGDTLKNRPSLHL